MILPVFLHFAAAVVSLGLGVFSILRGWRHLSHWALGVGMAVLATESFFLGLSILAILPEELMHWQRWRFAAAALLPGIWLVFSLSLPHLNYKAVLAKWKWIILLMKR